MAALRQQLATLERACDAALVPASPPRPEVVEAATQAAEAGEGLQAGTDDLEVGCGETAEAPAAGQAMRVRRRSVLQINRALAAFVRRVLLSCRRDFESLCVPGVSVEKV